MPLKPPWITMKSLTFALLPPKLLLTSPAFQRSTPFHPSSACSQSRSLRFSLDHKWGSPTTFVLRNVAGILWDVISRWLFGIWYLPGYIYRERELVLYVGFMVISRWFHGHSMEYTLGTPFFVLPQNKNATSWWSLETELLSWWTD